MLIDVADDREFQRFLDEQEQRLHARLYPIIATGIRLHMSKGAVHGRDYIVKRGEPALLTHYRRVYKSVYGRTFYSQKQQTTGVTDFLSSQLSYLARHAANLIANIAQSVGDYLRNVIMDGVNKGWSNDRITREILDNVDDMSRSRAATIARTETHNSATAAMDETIQFQGIDVRTKTWWSVGDQRVRPSHAVMHGITIPYNEPFNTDDGDCMFPGDDSLNMEDSGLINCRCVCLYNTEESEEEY